MSSLHLIGLAGTAGAGKDTAADIMCKMFGMQNLSSGDALRAITRYVYHLDQTYNPVRDQLYEVGNHIRTVINPAALVELCILQAEVLKIDRAIITGLRSMGEAQAVRAAGGIIVVIDADPHIRYDRIFARGRDAETQKTLEEFMEQDTRENRGISDQGPGRGIKSIIESADVVILNNAGLPELQLELNHKIAPLMVQ
ncbi:MAG TPA: AAA family ATPase [Patescibacteria group bacterium]|nr:AAA family ATPase [Patescibacteria group bacterium]